MPNPNPNPNQAMAEIPVDSLLARTQEAHAARRAAMNRSVTPPPLTTESPTTHYGTLSHIMSL